MQAWAAALRAPAVPLVAMAYPAKQRLHAPALAVSPAAQAAPPLTWRFGGNGAVLAVAGFLALCRNLDPKTRFILVPAAAAQGLIFWWCGTHSEGERR